MRTAGNAHKCKDKYCMYFHEAQGRMAAGEYIRCSAMGQDSGRVKVAFQGKHDDKWFTMDPATYDAYPLLFPVTPNDYATVAYVNGHGPITPCKVRGFYGDGAQE